MAYKLNQTSPNDSERSSRYKDTLDARTLTLKEFRRSGKRLLQKYKPLIEGKNSLNELDSTLRTLENTIRDALTATDKNVTGQILIDTKSSTLSQKLYSQSENKQSLLMSAERLQKESSLNTNDKDIRVEEVTSDEENYLKYMPDLVVEGKKINIPSDDTAAAENENQDDLEDYGSDDNASAEEDYYDTIKDSDFYDNIYNDIDFYDSTGEYIYYNDSDSLDDVVDEAPIPNEWEKS